MPTYFAEIDKDGTVLRVIASSAEFVKTLGGEWVETFIDGGPRKNYAGPGYRFDASRDAFVPPKPHGDATFDETTCRWICTAKEPA